MQECTNGVWDVGKEIDVVSGCALLDWLQRGSGTLTIPLAGDEPLWAPRVKG